MGREGQLFWGAVCCGIGALGCTGGAIAWLSVMRTTGTESAGVDLEGPDLSGPRVGSVCVADFSHETRNSNSAKPNKGNRSKFFFIGMDGLRVVDKIQNLFLKFKPGRLLLRPTVY
jgi:hypothetical protein